MRQTDFPAVFICGFFEVQGNMIKAIFFDIDSTLVSHTISDIPPGVLEAFDILRSKGVLLFLATGRHISEYPALPLHSYPFDGYIMQTGQICYDSSFHPLYEQPLSAADTRKLVDLFDMKEIPIVLVNRESLYINYVNDLVVRTQASISTRVPPVGKYMGEALFGGTVFGSREETGKIAAQLPGCMELRWNPHASDLISSQAGKERGVRKMLEHYGIAREETMAFGDADNDLDMISFAGIGIAMGNGTPLLKKNADYITDSVDSGGILSALRHYELID